MADLSSLTRASRWPTEDTLRAWVENKLDTKRLYAAIDSDPALVGAGVIYLDARLNAVVIRDFRPICHMNPIRVILREMPADVPPGAFAERLRNDYRESRVVGEMIAAGISCAGATIGWIGVAAISTTIPLTGGLSSAAVAVTHAATAATIAQCAVGLVRTAGEIVDPAFNAYLDSQEWYISTAAALDMVSLAGVIGAGYGTARMVLNLERTTGKGVPQILRGLNRQERAQLTRELQRLNHPGVSARILKDMRHSGVLPKRYMNAEIQKATWHQIRDAIGGVLGLAGSTRSGVVNGIAVGLYEEVAQ